MFAVIWPTVTGVVSAMFDLDRAICKVFTQRFLPGQTQPMAILLKPSLTLLILSKKSPWIFDLMNIPLPQGRGLYGIGPGQGRLSLLVHLFLWHPRQSPQIIKRWLNLVTLKNSHRLFCSNYIADLDQVLLSICFSSRPRHLEEKNPQKTD